MDGFGPQKRLTKVKEEPQEREDDFEIVNNLDDSHVEQSKLRCMCGWRHAVSGAITLVQSCH